MTGNVEHLLLEITMKRYSLLIAVALALAVGFMGTSAALAGEKCCAKDGKAGSAACDKICKDKAACSKECKDKAACSKECKDKAACSKECKDKCTKENCKDKTKCADSCKTACPAKK